jgi:hypothetical protein
MRQSHDHYICRAHMRRWATDNRVTALRRGEPGPEVLDIGIRVAAEQGLNDPSVEAAYGKVEDAFSRALPRLLDPLSRPTDRDWRAVREYAVLMHDRYPALRGSAADEHGLPGGNAVMVTNPANWGRPSGLPDSLVRFATTMSREQLKAARSQLLPLNARSLPPINQVFHIGPMLLGDAGVHAIALQPDDKTAHTFVAMPLSPGAMIVFGNELVEDAEVLELASVLTTKVAMESTVVVDTLQAPVIEGYVAEMWGHQLEPSGAGLPKAVRVWSRIEDIPDPGSNAPKVRPV